MKRLPLYLFILLSLLYCSVTTHAQTSEVDSLNTVIKIEKKDTNKVNTLNALSICMLNIGNYKASDSVAEVALQVSEELNYKKGQANAYNNLGNVSYTQGNNQEALKNKSNALNMYKELGDKRAMASTYGNLGVVYTDEGNYPDALKNYFASLTIWEETKDKRGLAKIYGNIGVVYDYEGDYANVLKYDSLALKMSEELGDKKIISNSYDGLGIVYAQRNDYANSLKNFTASLKISEELGDERGIASTCNNIGGVYNAQADYPHALENFFASLKASEEAENKRSILISYSNIGEVYTKEKKYSEAKEYLDKGMDLAKETRANNVICDNYSDRTDLDIATGNYAAAYADYKEYIVYRDSLKNEENTKKIVSEQMTYEFDKKQAGEKAERDKKEAIDETNRKKQQILTASVSLGLLLVLIFSGVLFNRFRLTQRQKKIIEDQKVLVEEKNKEVLDSITYAKRLQDAILPPLSIIKKYFPESFVLYKPKDIVAGDFYWMERSGGNILIAACDCTGHGVPGAMVSVVCSNALNRTVKEFKITEPGKILDKVRELVIETFEKSESEVQDGMDISLASLSPSKGGITIQWAGANNTLLYVENGEMKEIHADKQPIGRYDNLKPFTTHTITLNPPSEGREAGTLYLFTDGYADQFGGPKGKKFKYKQLQEKILSIASMNMDKQKDMLDETLETWRGKLEQVDDILIMGIRV